MSADPPSYTRRAPVQGDHNVATRRVERAGTIAWSEHLRAWEGYARRFGRDQSAERIAERGGFSFAEVKEYLGGHEPTTWGPLEADGVGEDAVRAKTKSAWEKMSSAERDASNAAYKERADMDYFHIYGRPTVCYECERIRVHRGGEQGSRVLNGEHWLCDGCTVDNRAAVQAEARGTHSLDGYPWPVREGPIA